jgi:syntaxin 5
MNTLGNKKTHNQYIYTSVPNDEDDILDIDISMSTNASQSQATMQMQNNRNQYYQDRNVAVQGIEKMMSELSTMFTRLGQAIHEQRAMIEKIDNNLDISMNNIEMGHKEIIKMQSDVRSNRGLLLKIFFIVIVSSVIYILFLS